MRKLIILIAFILLINSCGKRQVPVVLKNSNNKNSSTFKIIRKSMSSFITLPGEFFPFQQVDLFPKVNGFVKNVFVDRGFIVKTGQVLLQMEAPEIDQQLNLAKSKLVESQAILSTKKQRNDMLSETAKTPGSVSPFDLESAHNEYISAQASVKTEEANVAAFQAMENYLTLVAPFDGVITQRNVHPGAFVGPNSPFKDPVLVLKQTNVLRLTVYVPEVYVNKIDENSDVSFYINALPNKEFKRKISRLSQSVNDQDRSEAIEIDVVNEPDIKPGMYAEVKVPVKTSGLNSFIVPYTAILTNTERKYIVELDNKKHAHFIDVNEGITDGKTTEIFGQLNENMEVLIKPESDIREGDLIE